MVTLLRWKADLSFVFLHIVHVLTYVLSFCEEERGRDSLLLIRDEEGESDGGDGNEEGDGRIEEMNVEKGGGDGEKRDTDSFSF